MHKKTSRNNVSVMNVICTSSLGMRENSKGQLNRLKPLTVLFGIFFKYFTFMMYSQEFENFPKLVENCGKCRYKKKYEKLNTINRFQQNVQCSNKSVGKHF